MSALTSHEMGFDDEADMAAAAAATSDAKSKQVKQKATTKKQRWTIYGSLVVYRALAVLLHVMCTCTVWCL